LTAKAQWFVEAVVPLDDDQANPFNMPIEEVGERIDLREPGAILELRYAELLNREANLSDAGLTCPIKDRPDSTCHACPVSQAHDPEVRLSALCRIGREQESTLTEMAVISCHAS
jgi:hypothetical protein